MTQHNFFSIELPSRCKPYKDVDPSAIRVRAFTGGDEAMLAETTEKNAATKLTDVLGRCLEGVDIKEITLGDKLFLMVWHAINSYSDGFTATITCQHCLQQIKVSYNLADAEIVYLSDKFKEPIDVKLSDGTVAKCKLVRVKDEIQLERMAQTVENIYLQSIAMTIVNPEKDLMEKIKWLEDLPSKDVAKIRAVQDSFYHGPDFKMKYTCDKCAGEGKFTAPFRFEHLIPYGDALVKNFGVKV